MTFNVPNENSAEALASAPRGKVITACVLAFVASVAATVYFCRSMCCEMQMTGGWTMSMMWTRMPGQTWAASATSFQLMWFAMMVAMMLPSALPMFLNTKRAPVSLFVLAIGYFVVWVAAGVGIYALGITFAAAAMRWEFLSRAIPVFSGAALIAAGAFQFTRWKMTCLLRCRSPFGCASGGPEGETNFWFGCKQGATCCLCGAGSTMILVVLGMMNPFVIVGVTIVIAAEKMLPRPEITVRLVGLAAIVAGITNIMHKLSQ